MGTRRGALAQRSGAAAALGRVGPSLVGVRSGPIIAGLLAPLPTYCSIPALNGARVYPYAPTLFA